MKAVQVNLDEKLLAGLDADQQVRKRGRSAVLREVVAEYLERRRRASIASRYRRAYEGKPGLGKEFEGWEDQGVWPGE